MMVCKLQLFARLSESHGAMLHARMTTLIHYHFFILDFGCFTVSLHSDIISLINFFWFLIININ